MIKNHSKYYTLIVLLTVSGLFTSMVHYHSDGLKCLEHAEEAHIVEYDMYCPISTLVTDDYFLFTSDTGLILTTSEQTLFVTSEQAREAFIPSKQRRSATFLA